MTRSKEIVALAAGLLTLASGELAHADYVAAGAHACQPVYGSYVSQMQRSANGLGNSDTNNDIYVMCPLNFGYSPTNTKPIAAGVYLRFNDTSQKAIECKVVRTSFTGATWFQSSTKYSCATAGGCTTKFSCDTSGGTCTDVVSSYGGRNLFYWTASELGFSTYSMTDTVSIQCLIPRATYASNQAKVMSELVSYFIQ